MATSWPKLLRDELEFYRFNLHFRYNIQRHVYTQSVELAVHISTLGTAMRYDLHQWTPLLPP
jgi:hypothetical protein